jgi:hypothetical protein
MFFVSNRLPSSQAECRRFDPGLPLHKINKLQRHKHTWLTFGGNRAHSSREGVRSRGD